ncbi:MAG: diguanylate cyclase [Pseudomonadota bacterium]
MRKKLGGALFQLSFQDPQIEVVFNGNRHPELLTALAAAGFRPVVADAPIEFRTSVPILIDLASVSPAQLDQLGFSAAGELNRPVILFGALSHPIPPNSQHIHIAGLDQLASLPARLDLRRRSQLRENERQLRRETEQAFGNPLYFEGQAKDTSSPKVLYVGPIGTRFLPLSKGLAARGVQVFAAMTAQTARMHLDAEPFRLLLLDPSRSNSDIEQLVQGRGDLPVFIIGSGAEHGFDGCISLDEDGETAYEFIAQRAKSVPLRTQLPKVRLGATSHDPLTGLYSEAFLKAHLPRQMEACAQYETPLTLLNLRCRDGVLSSDEMLAVSRTIVANLRETDLLSRIDQTSFIAVLRDTPYAGAAQLASRLLQVIAQLEGVNSGLANRIVWRAVERRGSFTPEGLLQSAQSGPYSRSLAA